jgi:hypothetical protein
VPVSQKVHPWGGVHCSPTAARFLLVACCSQEVSRQRVYITFFIRGDYRCIGGPYRRDCPSETRDSIVFSERLVLL